MSVGRGRGNVGRERRRDTYHRRRKRKVVWKKVFGEDGNKVLCAIERRLPWSVCDISEKP
jgi:hypothetical protein